MINIDGVDYIEMPDTNLPFGNVCHHCAFYGTPCYNRDDFNCHSDSRPDGMGVVFVLANKSLHPTPKVGAAELHRWAEN